VKKLKALFRKAWGLLGDDRVWLLLAGVGIAVAVDDAKSGAYSSAFAGLAISIVVGVCAWYGIANQRLEARG
jgi:hypothetical protein